MGRHSMTVQLELQSPYNYQCVSFLKLIAFRHSKVMLMLFLRAKICMN